MITIPNLLSLLRLCLVPALLLLAWMGQDGVFLVCFSVSLLTDVSDGFIARKLGQTSELGAKLDSRADFFMTLALPFCGWWLRPDAVRAEIVYLAAGLCFYMGAVLAGFVKFRRLTSYHTWGAKLAFVLIGIALLVVFAGGPTWPLRISMLALALSQAEEIAMTFILPCWRSDVPSVWHALTSKRVIVSRPQRIKIERAR